MLCPQSFLADVVNNVICLMKAAHTVQMFRKNDLQLQSGDFIGCILGYTVISVCLFVCDSMCIYASCKPFESVIMLFFHLNPIILFIISLLRWRSGVWKARTRRMLLLCWTRPVTQWWQTSRSFLQQFKLYTGWHHRPTWETGWVKEGRAHNDNENQ